MLVGTMEEVDAFLHTTPWSSEQTVGFYNWVLDDEPGWSVFVMSDPGDPDASGIVYAYGPGKQRAALVGCASLNEARRADAETRQLPRQDIRHLATLLKKDLEGSL